MSDAPYVQFFTSDFLGGTSGMTAATKGVYITLLCLMYDTEKPLSQATDALARRCGCTVPAFKKAIQALSEDGKITVDEGGIWSEKCEKHIAQRRERRNSAKAAAKKRWEKTQQKQGKADADALQPQCQPEPEPYRDTLTSNDVKGANAPTQAEVVDATKEAIWNRGVPFLTERGTPERQARSQIGKWLRDSGAEAVYDALAAASKSGTQDPIPYIEEVLKPEPSVSEMVKAAMKRIQHA
jgi:uncharacterized protein YdaU (DUF1376 family)